MFKKFLILVIIKIIYIKSVNITNKTYDYKSKIDHESETYDSGSEMNDYDSEIEYDFEIDDLSELEYLSEINYDDQIEEMFKMTIKEYLITNNIYGNETLEITPEYMRKIFLGAMTAGNINNIPEEYIKPLEDSATEFIEEQYNKKNRTVIKGSEVIDLFDINEIAAKFSEILEKQGFYDVDGAINVNIDNIIHQDL